MTDIVGQYISNYLAPRLRKSKLSDRQIQIISDDISSRLKSLLAIWHNKEYVAPLFEIVKEEALFYKPKSHVSIRSLVVLAVRNSFIEDVHSSAPFNSELKTEDGHVARTSVFIRELTSEAVSYFKDRIKRNDNFSSQYQNSLFDGLNEKYARIWKLLSKKSTKHLMERALAPVIAEQIKSMSSTTSKTVSIVSSGIDPRLDEGLLSQLKHLSDNPNDSVFFIPSFKHISRDPEKVLKVLDFLLFADVPIVTLNYCITSEKVSIRNGFLQPIHNNSELKRVLLNTSGTDKEHARILRGLAKMI